MNRSGLQRIIPAILVLIVIVIAIAALVSIGRTIFGGSSSPSPAAVVNTGKRDLTSTLADRSVRMTVRGPIVASENYHSYTITASPDARNMTTYVGYLGQKVDNNQLPNNTQAYTEFVYALSRANLMEGTPIAGDNNDTRGICATGMLYEFEVLKSGKTTQKLWTTTCSGSQGSLKASLKQVTKLFQVQIPDFYKLTSKINL